MIMKKRILSLLAAVLVVSGLTAINSKTVSASSNSYGRIGEITPPARMKGNWYYRGSKSLGQNPHLIYEVHVTNHKINGVKLYQADLNITNKYALHYKKYPKVVIKTMDWGITSIYNNDNIKWVNVRGWTAGAGNGTSYGLVLKKHHGKLVHALAIGYGYKPTIAAYAYRAKDLRRY